MLSGAEVKVNTVTFQNDVEDIKSKDDVLTYMIHLGYLGYNEKKKTAFVPNEEIRQELTTAVESTHWNEMLLFQQESEQLLDATLDMDGKEVAKQIEKIHNEYVSVIQYNNENSLSSVLAIAYLSAMQYYFKPIPDLMQYSHSDSISVPLSVPDNPLYTPVSARIQNLRILVLLATHVLV